MIISDAKEYRGVLLHRTANRFANFCPEGRQSPINVRSVLLVGATSTKLVLLTQLEVSSFRARRGCVLGLGLAIVSGCPCEAPREVAGPGPGVAADSEAGVADDEPPPPGPGLLQVQVCASCQCLRLPVQLRVRPTELAPRIEPRRMGRVPAARLPVGPRAASVCGLCQWHGPWPP